MLFFGKNSNKFDYYLFIIIVSLAFGALGGYLQVSRVVGILLLPQLFMIWPNVGEYFHRIVSFTRFFLIYALLSFIWTPDVLSGFKEILYYIIHFVLFFEILAFSCLAKDYKITIAKSWLILVSITLVIAYWEIITGIHLSIAFQDSDEMKLAVYGFRRFASVTFGNYNAYVTFLCFSFPFLLFMFNNFKTQKEMIWVSLVLVLSFACVLINASRGGIIAIPLMFAISFILSKKSFKNIIPMSVVVVVAIYACLNYGELLFSVFDDRMDNGVFNDNERTYIWTVAINCFLHSFGFGVGIGGIVQSFYAETNKFLIPHNLFIEVLMEFGIIIFFLFISTILSLIKKTNKSNDKDTKIVSYCFLFSLPIVGVIDSSYCLSPLIFVVFSSIMSFVYPHSLMQKRYRVPTIIKNEK